MAILLIHIYFPVSDNIVMRDILKMLESEFAWLNFGAFHLVGYAEYPFQCIQPLA
mgnify:CR=1 FL=1